MRPQTSAQATCVRSVLSTASQAGRGPAAWRMTLLGWVGGWVAVVWLVDGGLIDGLGQREQRAHAGCTRHLADLLLCRHVHSPHAGPCRPLPPLTASLPQVCQLDCQEAQGLNDTQRSWLHPPYDVSSDLKRLPLGTKVGVEVGPRPLAWAAGCHLPREGRHAAAAHGSAHPPDCCHTASLLPFLSVTLTVCCTSEPHFTNRFL
jgi:hypothetical protein